MFYKAELTEYNWIIEQWSLSVNINKQLKT